MYGSGITALVMALRKTNHGREVPKGSGMLCGSNRVHYLELKGWPCAILVTNQLFRKGCHIESVLDHDSE